MTSAMIVGGLFGLGMLLLLRGLVPPRPDLAAAVGRWELARIQATRERGTPLTRAERVGRWTVDQLARRGLDLATLRPDLNIVGKTPEAWVARTMLSVIMALLLPALLGALATMLGLGVGYGTPIGAGVVLAVAAAIVEIAQLRSEARERRAELLQALATYLDMFSMCLAGGRGVPEAMTTSARIGRGWAFELIQDTITQARRSGVTPWQALIDLGDDVALHELVDLGSALLLVGDSGARVRASLAARAGTLRRRQLAEAAAKALKNDDSMRVSQLLMALGFMVLIGYPAVVNVLAV